MGIIIKRAIILLAVAALVSGCANPINRKTYERYLVAGNNADILGDLRLDKQNYSRAVVNAQIGFLGSEAEATALFRYARILGNLCEHDEAVKHFIEANRLMEKENDAGSESTYTTLAEIGQLYYDIGRYSESVPYLGRAFEIAQRHTLAKRSPASFADAYADYADALRRTGNGAKAVEVSEKSATLKAKGGKVESEYIRYPISCD